MYISSDSNSDDQLTFVYIDNKEQLFLPLFVKNIIDSIQYNNMKSYTKKLYNKYSDDNSQIEELLDPIAIQKIPIELLSKYYARLYTIESNFCKDMNKNLRGLNNLENYLPYIKTLYEGVKLKSLPLCFNNILYRGSKLSNIEIKKIMNRTNINDKIIFAKSFISFYKDKNIAESFLKYENSNQNLPIVLYIH